MAREYKGCERGGCPTNNILMTYVCDQQEDEHWNIHKCHAIQQKSTLAYYTITIPHNIVSVKKYINPRLSKHCFSIPISQHILSPTSKLGL